MNKINLTFLSLIITTLLFSATPVFAQDFGMNKLINDQTRAQNQASRAAERQTDQLSNLIKRANKAVDNRVDELNRLSTRIQNDKRLSADEKSTLTANIQTDITSLTNLKVKINADTDISTARTDIKQILAIRVYSVVVPQTRLLIVIDNLSALTSRLQGLTPKIQNLINNLKSQGKDVSALQPLLDDINSQLSTISSKLTQDKSTVLAVTATTSDPHSVFVSVRQDLSAVRQDFSKIRSDVGQMRQAFKGAIHNTTGGPTSSSSATH